MTTHTHSSRTLPLIQVLLSLLLLLAAIVPAPLLAQDEEMPPAPAAAMVPACPPAGSATELTGAGATFPAPLYTRWFDEYSRLCNVRVNYQAIGSGGGIQQHTAKTVQFGASDGIMTDAQKTAAPGTLAIPMVAGSVAPVVNIPGLNPGDIHLDGPTLAGIYLGEITRWTDPKIMASNEGVNLPNQDIIVVRRSDGSGTTNIFTSYLSAISDSWRSRVGAGNSVNWPVGLGGEGNAGVAGQVRQLPGSIGYVELAYAKQNNMAWVWILNQAGNFIQPSLESTTAAMEGITIPASTEVMIVNSPNPTAFPIAGFTWVLVYQDQTNAAAGQTIAALLWWMTHDAQAMAATLDYAQLSPAAQQSAEAQIRRITNGGQPIIR